MVHRGECQDCHGEGIIPSKVCADCHNGTFRPLPNHTSAETSHTAPAGGVCVNDHCHDRNVLTLHDESTHRCAACHEDGTDPTLVCGTCHTGDPFSWTRHPAAKHTADTGTCVQTGCHVSSVSTIHAALVGGGCPTCHNNPAAPTRECTTCHTDTYAVLHAHGDAPHVTANNSSCVKAECHGEVIATHTEGTTPPGCTACHAAGQPLTLACGTTGACHAGKGMTSHKADALASGAHVASPSVDATPGACLSNDCHIDSHGVNDVEFIHRGKCSRCHGEGTATSKVCASCHTATSIVDRHAVHEVTTHTVGPANTCATGSPCHNTDVSRIHVKNSLDHCEACHANGEEPSTDCVDCHTGGFTASHPVSHPTMTVIREMQPPGGLTCMQTGCHPFPVETIHEHLAGEDACICHKATRTKTFICTTGGCHATFTPPNDHLAHLATVASADIWINSVNYGPHGCNECHINELQQIHGDEAGCTKCHPSPRNSVPPWAGGCVEGGCHAADGAFKMHGAIDATHTLSFSPICAGADCHGGSDTPDVAALHTDHAGVRHCDACHAEGQTLTLVCTTDGCHSNDDARPYDIALAHPDMAAHTTGLDPGATCLKAGCHTTYDLAALHAPGPRCVPCHGEDGVGGTLTQDCNNSACHGDESGNAYEPSSTILHVNMNSRHDTDGTGCTDTTQACHSKNVRIIHNGQWGADANTRYCAACHAAGKPDPQTLNCLTADCHTVGGGGGGGSFPPGHPAPPELHTVSPQPSCSDCHSGGGDVSAIHSAQGCVCHQSGKSVTLTCTASGCHSDGDAHPFSSPHDYGAAHSAAANNQCNGCHNYCWDCHSTSWGDYNTSLGHSELDSMGGDLPSYHSSQGGCAACHTGASAARDCWSSGCHNGPEMDYWDDM